MNLRSELKYRLGYIVGVTNTYTQRFPPSVQHALGMAPLLIAIFLASQWKSELILLLVVYNYILIGNFIVTRIGMPKYIPCFSIAQGRSMYPAIPGGFVANLSVAANTVEAGDIVVFENNDGDLVHHRIIKSNGNGQHILKGDNNPVTDGIYTDDDILCKTKCIRGIPIYIPLSLTAWIETLIVTLPNYFGRSSETDTDEETEQQTTLV